MIAYSELRCGYQKDTEDTRFVWFGIRYGSPSPPRPSSPAPVVTCFHHPRPLPLHRCRYIIERVLHRRWTMDDITRADHFFSTHQAGYTPFPWPKDLFTRIVTDHDGYLPLTIKSLPEGTVANARVPVVQITASGDFSRLVTFMETVLTQLWYPSTVATLSRRVRSVLEQAMERSAEGGAEHWFIEYMLHDFGFRGCCTIEQAVLGGAAHLLSFRGSDTMAAAYYTQQHLNNGRPVATSVPATEHSVMTAWPTERGALENMMDHFGGEGSTYSVVFDSYDYAGALQRLLPVVKARKLAKGGTMVIRPDSGDPMWCTVEGVRALDKVFGSTVNAKGYKVVNGARVLQGDGMMATTIAAVVEAVMDAGYSAENAIFGMGGGLLQKVHRDTMSFATKLCHITYADGTERRVMKKPTTDSSKISLPGEMQVRRVKGVPTVFPAGVRVCEGVDDGEEGEDLLRVVYDHGPLTDDPWAKAGTFDEMRARMNREWATCPPRYDPLSPQMHQVIQETLAEFDAGDRLGY